MNAAVKLFLQKLVDGAMTGNATQSLELARYNTHTKMCLAGAVVNVMMAALFVVMTCMKMAFIYNFKPFRRESSRKLCFH